jgi:hypothetical protein
MSPFPKGRIFDGVAQVLSDLMLAIWVLRPQPMPLLGG